MLTVDLLGQQLSAISRKYVEAIKIELPVHTRERRRLRKRSGGVKHKLIKKRKML